MFHHSLELARLIETFSMSNELEEKEFLINLCNIVLDGCGAAGCSSFEFVGGVGIFAS